MKGTEERTIENKELENMNLEGEELEKANGGANPYAPYAPTAQPGYNP